MINKEKLKKSIDNDFSKNNNYNKIIKKVEGKDMKVKNNIWKWSLAPICLVVIISGILFINSKNKNDILNYIDKEDNIKLNINSLDKIGAALYDAEVKEISTDGISSEWHEILKDLNIPEDLNIYNNYSIYTRKDKTSDYDILNCHVYNYSNQNDDYKNIRIALSDTNKPIRDYLFSNEGSKDTIIDDVKIKIFSYNNIYFTEFKYKNYNIDIETVNINEQELLSLLVSIIK